jgi:hypothetical protein
MEAKPSDLEGPVVTTDKAVEKEVQPDPAPTADAKAPLEAKDVVPDPDEDDLDDLDGQSS